MFDAISYLKHLGETNKLAREHHFAVDETEGMEGLQPVMEKYRKTANFIMVDDAVDGAYESNKVGWFNRRTFTVFILATFREDSVSDRNAKLDVCREIYRQFLSRLIADSGAFEYDLIYMRTGQIRYRELNSYNLGGLTGVVFMLTVDEPTDLEYNEDEWNQ